MCTYHRPRGFPFKIPFHIQQIPLSKVAIFLLVFASYGFIIGSEQSVNYLFCVTYDVIVFQVLTYWHGEMQMLNRGSNYF